MTDDARNGADAVPLDVLVVDDDQRNLDAIEGVLDGLHLRMRLCNSGEAALGELLVHDFAVILLDIKLPGLTGFETARMIRARPRSRHVPIIFITGYDQAGRQVTEAYELGAVDYLIKPIVPRVLRAKVSVFVDLRKRTLEIERQAAALREAERRVAAGKLDTERKKWETRVLRRQIRSQRELAERLAEIDRRKDQFIAMLAHELRNPLVPLVIGLRLVRGAVTPQIRDVHDAMRRQLNHLTRLVDDLLDIARVRQGKLELHSQPLDLYRVVEDACAMCRPEMEQKGHALIVDGPDRRVSIRADATRMTQVVSNLLRNASQHSNGAGRIWLTWGVEAGEAFVRVSDEGHGIAPAFLGRVFDPFTQAHNDGRGLGLGLALVQELVRRHDGRVEVDSEGEGRGSCFTVRLPAFDQAAGDVPAASAASATGLHAVSRRLRVVIIEDNPDVGDLVCSLVESWGHDVVALARDGREGLAALVEHKPDVAIVDVGLPDLSGHDVARQVCDVLREQRPGLIAMTGFGDAAARDAAREAGFDVHLTKPPDPDMLRQVVETLQRPGRRNPAQRAG